MTTRPRVRKSRQMAVGVLAVGLFGILAVIFATSGFGTADGFQDGEITASIGYAMFNLDARTVASEGFLVAFITIAIVLDAALDGAVMLAKKEGEQ
ncbi:MAG: proton-conducting membrane transporter [Natronomonas sp.]